MTERPASATPQAAAAAAEAAARGGYGKLVAFLAARSGDLAGAEDALADAFAAALAAWPRTGVPPVRQGARPRSSLPRKQPRARVCIYG